MKKNDKIDWIISLRAICTIAIILIHVINGWSSDLVGKTSFLQNSFRMNFDKILLNYFTSYAVPCFIMITGVLLLNHSKEINFKKIWKYEKRMLLAIITFGFLFCIIEQIFNFGFSAKNVGIILVNSIINLLSGKSWDVMWYVYMMLGLYFVIPIIKPYIVKSNNSELKIILIILFIFDLLIPTISMIFDFNIYNPIMFSVYIFYLLMGYAIYIRKLFSINFVNIMGLIGFMGIFIYFAFQNKYTNINFGCSNMFVAMFSIFIFYYFSINGNKISNNKIIQITSKYSFGIYLVHTLFLNIFNKFLHIFPSILPVLLGEILFLLVTYLLSLFSSYIMSKIPILKRLI